jgi:hypothetical protein
MGRAGLERAYSPKAWLATQHGLRVQNTYRGFAYSGLVSFTPGGKLPTPDKSQITGELPFAEAIHLGISQRKRMTPAPFCSAFFKLNIECALRRCYDSRVAQAAERAT